MWRVSKAVWTCQNLFLNRNTVNTSQLHNIMPVLLRLEEQSLKERRLKVYSLPELNHRRRGVGVGDVGGVFSVVVDTVLCGYAKV